MYENGGGNGIGRSNGDAYVSRMLKRTQFRISDALKHLHDQSGGLSESMEPKNASSTVGAMSRVGLNTFCFDESILYNGGGNASFSPLTNNTNSTIAQPMSAVVNPQMLRLRTTFRIIMVSISIIGVAGNVLNLLTLRSPSLRTVPFKYIRALAVYDLISLTAILVHFLLEVFRFDASLVVYYKVWVEDVLINSFLVAGLYVAVFLTIERYLLIRQPHKKSRLLSIENTVALKIALALMASILLHLPMVLQNTMKRDPITGRLIKGNNQRFLCREPYWTIFNYYKMLREFLRFFCVVILMSLNIVIAKSLQIAKKNRRMLIKRTSQADFSHDFISLGSGTSMLAQPVREKSKKDLNLLKSFTEKKLTVLMGAICLIYVIGNVPQMVVMVVQNEALNDMFSFQVFRNVANTLEVLNHCLNFFIFCMASSEYTRAFLLNNCSCLRRFLLRFSCIADFINARRANSLFDDLQSTVSDMGAVNMARADSTSATAAVVRKHSTAAMSSVSPTLQPHAEIVRRKSASMCLPMPPTVLDGGVVVVADASSMPTEQPHSSASRATLASASTSLIKMDSMSSMLTPTKQLQNQQRGSGPRGSVCVSLLRGEKTQVTYYRDNLHGRRESMRPSCMLKQHSAQRLLSGSVADALPSHVDDDTTSSEPKCGIAVAPRESIHNTNSAGDFFSCPKYSGGRSWTPGGFSTTVATGSVSSGLASSTSGGYQRSRVRHLTSLSSSSSSSGHSNYIENAEVLAHKQKLLNQNLDGTVVNSIKETEFQSFGKEMTTFIDETVILPDRPSLMNNDVENNDDEDAGNPIIPIPQSCDGASPSETGEEFAFVTSLKKITKDSSFDMKKDSFASLASKMSVRCEDEFL